MERKKRAGPRLERLPSQFGQECDINAAGNSPITKQSDGYFRFQCPGCGVLRATVNPRNNLAHCFSCSRNFNNIDLLMTQGYDFIPAVEILEQWLRQYQQDRGSAKS